MYLCLSQSPDSSYPFFPAWYSCICFLYLCLGFCFANKFICNIFLDSTYILIYHICFSPSDLLYLCLCFCFANEFICTIFLDSTYMLIYNICFSPLTAFTLMVSRFIDISTNDPISFLFNGWLTFHCRYVPHLLYPFTCWWASRFLPCPSYCK